ncbi:hypothetical protein BT96DRAFT_815057, partial [Gymnopus androsaceus JB14]
PLQWWINNRKVYPNLAKLAILVHLIPGVYFLRFFFCIILLLPLPSNSHSHVVASSYPIFETVFTLTEFAPSCALVTGCGRIISQTMS